MAEEISDFVSKLRIDDEEECVLDLKTLNATGDKKISLLLLGRILTERTYNVEAFKRTITTVWASIHGLVIRVLSPNMYAFQFFHWKDMMKVLDGRPWCFDNMLILLKEADGDEQPDQVNLFQSPFWVRIKNLPFNSRSDEIIRALVGNMGEILEIEEDILGFGKYRRVKVMLDVTKPLRRFRRMKDNKGKEIVVDFAYERLPFFCFACGVMGHSEKDCQFVDEEDKHERLGWSLALKATPRKGRTKELEEENKFRTCRKTLFSKEDLVKGRRDDGPHKEDAASSVVTQELTLVSVEESPLNGASEAAAFNDYVGHKDTTPLTPPTTHNLLPPVMETQPTAATFVFSSQKKVVEGKSRPWKRIIRSVMEDKGGEMDMETDITAITLKRACDNGELVINSDDSATKRPKLSTATDIADTVLAEVGSTQPRLAL